MFVTHATGSWWPPIPDIETGFLGVYLVTCPACDTGAFGAVLCSRFKHMQQTHGAILNLLDPYSHGHWTYDMVSDTDPWKISISTDPS